jgi:hypothetical protein
MVISWALERCVLSVRRAMRCAFPQPCAEPPDDGPAEVLHVSKAEGTTASETILVEEEGTLRPVVCKVLERASYPVSLPGSDMTSALARRINPLHFSELTQAV